MSLPRILLVDEDPVSRQALAEVLEAQGFAVLAGDRVPEGAEADLVVATPPVASGTVPQIPLTKPVRVGALLAAIREALARAAGHVIRIGRWRFDPGARLLEDDAGTRVRLTDKETAILEHLHRAGGVVPRERLLAEVWGYKAAVTTHTLETHIYRLRRKIETDPARVELLVTEPGGYRLAPQSRGSM